MVKREASDPSASVPAWNLRLRSKRLADKIRRIGWSVPVIATGLLVILRLVGGAMGYAASEVSAPGVLLFLSTPLWLLAARIVDREQRVETEGVRVEGRSLSVQRPGKAPLRFGPIAQGAEMGNGLMLQDVAGTELTLGTEHPAALLDQLDLEPAKRRFTFRWRAGGVRAASFIATLLGTAVLSALVLGPLGHTSLGTPLLCLAFGASPLVADLVSRFSADRGVSIGLDGIAAERFGRTRLFRFADITHVQATDGELLIVTKDRKVHRALADPKSASERTAIDARIREAMAAAKASMSEHPDLSALLERAGRSLPEWRAAAARMLTAATGFRDGGIGAGELTSVLEDVGATAEQRVAAAIALTSQPELRPKIRVAAETCASPRLRVALEALAEGDADDETIGRALEEAER